MKIVISSGHGKYIRGASGYPVPPQLDEVDEARRVVEAVADLWREMGVDVKTFHDNTSHDQGTNLETIVDFHNAQGPHDLDVSVHFNAYDGNAHGAEVLYVTQADLADKVCDAICAAGKFTNRGPKYRGDLYFLNNTYEPSILLETCFCDNTDDSNKYRDKFDAICQAIAESISGQEVGPKPEPEPEPEPEPPTPPTGDNAVRMAVRAKGSIVITFNNQDFVVGSDAESSNRVIMTLATEGDVRVTINGQDFHNLTPPEPEPGPDPEPEENPSERPVLRRGDRGSEVEIVQECVGCGVIDGEFGPDTESAVIEYQRKNGLDADGCVGADTWTQLAKDFGLPDYPPPALPELSQRQMDDIAEIAINSEIASYTWRDRGQAPIGYIKGMAFAFATMLRKLNAGDPVAAITAQADRENDSADALSWYADEFRAKGMDNSKSGIDTLRHLMALQIGLGMRETSGEHCCGRDMSADNVSSDTAEAGLFQMSWNASSCSTDMEKLLVAYESYGNCQQSAFDLFSEDVSCSSSDWASYGSGTGYTYQELAKECPQFAVETAALGMRYLRQHWGPINRKEVELRSEAEAMLLDVQEYMAPSA